MHVAIVAACCCFALMGLVLIPYAGIQADEAIFSFPLYHPIFREFRIVLFHKNIPLMVISYIGTLKTLFYWLLFKAVRPNVWSLRLPMVFAGSITVFIFFKLAKIMAGARAALAAALLLASDPIYLLTNTFDWGPVAIEHLLLVTGCLLVAQGRLSFGCFVFGLALWNKAIFVWALAGLIAATSIGYWPQVRSVFKDRRVIARAAAMFLLGSLPFLIYNVHRRGETFRSNAHLSLENFNGKLIQVESATRGAALFGYIVNEDSDGPAKAPISVHGRTATWIHGHFGEHRNSLFFYALLIAILLTPVWWRSPARRAGMFALVFSITTFLAMAVTKDAGGSAHHIVLLWPMPHLLAGVAIAALRPRWLLPAGTVVLVAANLLVFNQYLYQFERDGAGPVYTDALFPLSDALADWAGKDWTRHPIYAVDWGMVDPVSLLNRGRIDIRASHDPFMTPNPTDLDRQIMARMFADPNGLFVSHVRGREVFSQVNENLENAAHASGYSKQEIRVIPDSNGRSIFELFRLYRKDPNL